MEVDNAITIDELERLDLAEDREWELHSGRLVGTPLPDLRHRRLQAMLVTALDSLFPNALTLCEFPFQIPERLEVRSADVGISSRDRVAGRILTGAPDLVVEILSPSNSIAALNQYRRLGFESGTSVFWQVDPDEKTVDVFLAGQKFHRTYEPGDEIPLALFGCEVQIPVDDIFRNL